MRQSPAKPIHARLTAAVFTVLLLLSCRLPAQVFTLTIPQSGANPAAGTSSGFSTNAFRDGNLLPSHVAPLAPKLLRWPEGVTGNKMHFNVNNPAVFNIGIRNSQLWWTNYMNVNTSTWTCTPEFNFDEFIATAKSAGAEPVVIIGIQAIYSTEARKMTRAEVIQAAKDFVFYANVTKKYGVKYWEIGNEDDLEGCSAADYASIINELVPQLRAIDPNSKFGANRMTSLADWNALLPLISGNVDFLVTHCYSWLGANNYNGWYPNENNWDWTFNAKYATDALNANPNIPKSLFVTEISSHAPGAEPTGVATNVTWKGLHNIQMHLEALSRPYTKASLFWTSRWSDNATETLNAFNPSYGLTPMGLSLKVISNNLYSNLISKQDANLVTAWVSYNATRDKMSVFLLNRSMSATSATVTINGFAGTSWNHLRMVYTGSGTNTTDATYTQQPSTAISSNTFTVGLDKLSCTVLNFGATAPAPPPLVLRPADNPTGTVNGLDYKYYLGLFSTLPDYNALTPNATGTVANFSLTPRTRETTFAFRYKGYISVPVDGEYTFYTASDEGSRLYIGNTMVVDNDGLHTVLEKSGKIALAAGKHPITVDYFQRRNEMALTVSYDGPGISKIPIPDGVLSRLPSGARLANKEAWAASSQPRIHPNPATHRLEISCEEVWKTVLISNYAGRTVLQLTDYERVKIIPLDEYPKGLYMIRIQTGGGRFITKKIVVR